MKNENEDQRRRGLHGGMPACDIHFLNILKRPRKAWHEDGDGFTLKFSLLK